MALDMIALVVKVVPPRERMEFFSVAAVTGAKTRGSTEQIRLKRTTLREMAAASGMTWDWDYFKGEKR